MEIRKSKHTVWGDYLSSETRTILAIMDLQKIEHDFKLVDTLKEEHKNQDYLKHSFVETIPMISNE